MQGGVNRVVHAADEGRNSGLHLRGVTGFEHIGVLYDDMLSSLDTLKTCLTTGDQGIEHGKGLRIKATTSLSSAPSNASRALKCVNVSV